MHFYLHGMLLLARVTLSIRQLTGRDNSGTDWTPREYSASIHDDLSTFF